MRSGLLLLDVTREMCPWIPWNRLMAGTILFEYTGPYTYGCIDPGYIAVTTTMGAAKGFFQIDPRLILWSPITIDEKGECK